MPGRRTFCEITAKIVDFVLSQRANEIVRDLNTSWRFAPRGTYHPSRAPDGLVSFATAENTLVAQYLEDLTNKLVFPAGVFEYRYSTEGGSEQLTLYNIAQSAAHQREANHQQKDQKS